MSVFYLGAHQPHWLWRAGFPLFVSHRAAHPPPRRSVRLRAGGRWTRAGSPNCRCTAGGSPRPRTTPPPSPGTPNRSAGWTSPPRKTGCANRSCSPAPACRSPSTSTAPSRTTWPFASWRRTCRSSRWCRAGGWPTTWPAWTCTPRPGSTWPVLPRVGLGSVCRRQSTAEIAVIVTALAARGLRLHGFGIKTSGLHQYGHLLASADSMAWSYAARRAPALPGCTGHRNCANCLTYATAWRVPHPGRMPPAAGSPPCSTPRHRWEVAA